MTHWWAPLALFAILVALWLCTLLASALEHDRGWKWLTSRALATIPVLALLFLIDLVVPAWGDGRKLVVVLSTFMLGAIGELLHERRTGKRFITLPKKS